MASFSKSLELGESLGLTQHMIRVNLNLGATYTRLRRFSEAISAIARSEDMGERLGDTYLLTKALLAKGRAYAHTSEFCKAEKSLLRGLALANDNGYKRESALADEYMGELMIARGRYDEALVNLKKGYDAAIEIAPEGDMVAGDPAAHGRHLVTS